MTEFAWEMTVALKGGGTIRLQMDGMDLELMSEAEQTLVRSLALRMERMVGLRVGATVSDQASDVKTAASSSATVDAVGSTVATSQEPDPDPQPAVEPVPSARPGNQHVPIEVEPIEDRTCVPCGTEYDSVHGLRIHQGRRHKTVHGPPNRPLDAPVEPVATEPPDPVPAAPVVDDDAREAEPAGVGTINGVCGPCRRFHCQLCVTEGCRCARPGHWTVAGPPARDNKPKARAS